MCVLCAVLCAMCCVCVCVCVCVLFVVCCLLFVVDGDVLCDCDFYLAELRATHFTYLTRLLNHPLTQSPTRVLFKKCETGYDRDDSGKCVDIDECQNKTICKIGEYCSNTAGSHSCILCDTACSEYDGCTGPGITACVACKRGYEKRDEGCTGELLCGWVGDDDL